MHHYIFNKIAMDIIWMCSFIHLIEAGAVKLSGEDFTCTGKLQSFVRRIAVPDMPKKQWIFV